MCACVGRIIGVLVMGFLVWVCHEFRFGKLQALMSHSSCRRCGFSSHVVHAAFGSRFKWLMANEFILVAECYLSSCSLLTHPNLVAFSYCRIIIWWHLPTPARAPKQSFFKALARLWEIWGHLGSSGVVWDLEPRFAIPSSFKVALLFSFHFMERF